jgi:hypothetical protein
MAINFQGRQNKGYGGGGQKKPPHPHSLPAFWLKASSEGEPYFQSGKLTPEDTQRIIGLLQAGHDRFRIYLCGGQIDISTLPTFQEGKPAFNVRLIPPNPNPGRGFQGQGQQSSIKVSGNDDLPPF